MAFKLELVLLYEKFLQSWFRTVPLIQSLCGQVNSPDQTDTFGNFGAFMSRNFSSNAIRSNPRSIGLCYTIKFYRSDGTL
jgi:hypothetical protein